MMTIKNTTTKTIMKKTTRKDLDETRCTKTSDEDDQENNKAGEKDDDDDEEHNEDEDDHEEDNGRQRRGARELKTKTITKTTKQKKRR